MTAPAGTPAPQPAQMQPAEARLKRIRMRAWRRGTKEMDLILGPFADSELAALDAAGLEAFEALLEENDQDLYLWVAGQAEPPVAHAPMLRRLADHARQRLTPSR